MALAATVPLLLAVAVACSGSAATPGQPAIAPPPTATPASPPTKVAATPAATAAAPMQASPTVRPPATGVAPTSPPAPVGDDDKRTAITEASGDVYALLGELIAELGPRASGTEAELRAAELLKERYERLGYDAGIQPFTVRRFDLERWALSEGENAQVAIESPVKMKLAGLPMTTLPGGAEVSGPLTLLDMSGGGDLPTEGIEGRVIHFRFGDLNLGDTEVMLGLLDQVNVLAERGAVAVVFSRKLGEPGPYRLLLGGHSPIPALFISGDEGKSLEELAEAEGEVIAAVKIEVEVSESQNVIAELEGTGDGIVVIGAHYDTVPETAAGANDNASGTAVILALAQALAGQSLPFTVRFVSFGAEEVGLYGSTHYVASLSDAELGQVKAMLNFDVVGSGDYTAVSGAPQLTGEALKLAGELQLQARYDSLPLGAASDHTPFEQAGVPVLFFWAPDISRIHSPRDVMEFVDPRRIRETFLLAEALLTSGEFLP